MWTKVCTKRRRVYSKKVSKRNYLGPSCGVVQLVDRGVLVSAL